MSAPENPAAALSEPLKITLKNFCVAIAFGIAFGYIEAAVVVYLREIFHPDGFTFPMKVFGAGPLAERLVFTEISREAATLVLILTAAWLFGRNRRQQVAYFMTIFAVWDIFYYVWLKVLLGWPASLMDWDILFLIPVTWASPVLYPVLISITLLAFAMVLLFRPLNAGAIKVTWLDWLAFCVSGIIVVTSFCIAGLHSTEPDFASHFYRSLFASGYVLAFAAFVKCLLKSR
jgi:hypothetical protein